MVTGTTAHLGHLTQQCDFHQRVLYLLLVYMLLYVALNMLH
jgi:hypothetical protein